MTENTISFGSLRFLVVTDCEFTRDILHFALEAFLAEEIYDAASGAEALQALRTFVPDVLLTEMTLPDLDGSAVVRQLRAIPGSMSATAAAIMVADRPTVIEVLAAMKADTDDILRFPFSATVLAQRVTRVLINRRRFLATRRQGGRLMPPDFRSRPSRQPVKERRPSREPRGPLLTPEEIRVLMAKD